MSTWLHDLRADLPILARLLAGAAILVALLVAFLP